jgi:HEPN domain-containing protein
MPDESMQKAIRQEWFLRGEHDFQSAGLLLKQNGHTDTIAVLIQQAVEKYTKGFLLGRGWKLRKIHDLELLVEEATEYDKSFILFLDLARRLSAFYIEDRYPPGPPRDYSREEISTIFAQASDLITKFKDLSI